MNKFTKEEEDIISSLPDDLLSHILSFLPTPYAVRTSLLSKRWRHVWISIETLHFDDRLMNQKLHNIHDTIVDRFILNRDSSIPIRKLFLHCTTRSMQISHIHSWFHAAVARKIQELYIFLLRTDVPLPHGLIQSLSASETLQVLNIRCNFDLNFPISFACLKVLHLTHLAKNYDSVKSLLRSCPVLEELAIDSGWLGHGFFTEICVPTLKRLTIPCLGFNVTAPALESLHISHTNSSLCCRNQGMQLVSAVAKTINSLSLSSAAMCVLGSVCGTNLPMFPNLTRLELHVCNGFSWNLVIDFLKNSPKLEIFVLRKEARMCWHCLDAQSWSPQQIVPNSFLSHLKVLKIMGLQGRQDESELLKYLFENTKILDKVIIDSTQLDARNPLFENFLFKCKNYKSN